MRGLSRLLLLACLAAPLLAPAQYPAQFPRFSVPFPQGAGPSVAALLSGEASIGFATMPSVMSQVKAVAEAGLTGYDAGCAADFDVVLGPVRRIRARRSRAWDEDREGERDASRRYHLMELEIARDATDLRHMMPPIAERHRRILDVGCGAGQTLIASRLDSSVLAVGIDIDRDALALGRELAGNVAFACAKGDRLPFADSSFDLVVSRVALPYMPVLPALKEIARVLAPGGELWISLHPIGMSLAALRQHVARLDVRAALHDLYVITNGIALHLSGREFPVPFRRRYESFQTERSTRRALAAAGFEQVSIDRSRCFTASAVKRRIQGT